MRAHKAQVFSKKAVVKSSHMAKGRRSLVARLGHRSSWGTGLAGTVAVRDSGAGDLTGAVGRGQLFVGRRAGRTCAAGGRMEVES